jgi:hypothetical protein
VIEQSMSFRRMLDEFQQRAATLLCAPTLKSREVRPDAMKPCFAVADVPSFYPQTHPSAHDIMNFKQDEWTRSSP